MMRVTVKVNTEAPAVDLEIRRTTNLEGPHHPDDVNAYKVTDIATGKVAATVYHRYGNGPGTLAELALAEVCDDSAVKSLRKALLDAGSDLIAKHAGEVQGGEVQTRDERGKLRYFGSVASAFEFADDSRDVWKVSFPGVGGERVRMVRDEHIGWRYEPVLPSDLMGLPEPTPTSGDALVAVVAAASGATIPGTVAGVPVEVVAWRPAQEPARRFVSRPAGLSADDAAVDARCEVMHNAYELAAQMNGWETPWRSRVPWDQVPEANRNTMRAAMRALLDHEDEATKP